MSRVSQLWRSALACGALAVSGCVTLDQLAPPVEALSSPAGHSQLSRGRTLYVTTCAKCHSVEPVSRYTAAEWRDIMPDMADESKLTPADEAAVTAYIMAALHAPAL